MGLIVALAIQAASLEPVAATDEAMSQEQTDVAAEQTAEPARKRVCRSVMDTRTRDLGKRRQVCKFVEADKDEKSN